MLTYIMNLNKICYWEVGSGWKTYLYTTNTETSQLVCLQSYLLTVFCTLKQCPYILLKQIESDFIILIYFTLLYGETDL